VGLILLHFGWRWSFAATGIISFLYFLIFYWVYRSPDEDLGLSAAERELITAGGAVSGLAAPNQPATSLGFLLRQPKVLGLAMGWGAYNYSFYLLLLWLPSYLKMALNVDLLHSVLYTAVPWLFATFTDIFFGGWLVDTLISRGWNALRVRQSVMVGGMICGMGILGAAHVHTATGALFWISLSLGGLSAAAPVAWTVPALIAPPGGIGKVGGIVNCASQLAGISAPIITGYIVAATHTFASAFVTATVILLMGIAGYVFLLGRMEPIVPET
jgi:ACS family D-galactonate transporter-like MFS transporter